MLHPAPKRIQDRLAARNKVAQEWRYTTAAETHQRTKEGDRRERERRETTEDWGTPVPEPEPVPEHETAALAANNDWSDPDTASIASRDSDDLAARRPNRWQGNPRAWQHITELDRAVVAAMNRTRDRDLAAHLYNAFYMKKTADPDDPETWAPKAYWTAWPLRLRDSLGLGVFDDGEGQPGANDNDYDDDKHKNMPIFQSHERHSETRPSKPLEEMLTATIQRVAREQFYQRRRARQAQQQQEGRPEQPVVDNSMDTTTTQANAAANAEKNTDKNNANGAADAPAVVLADDELAAHLLHPSVRHLLTQVDKVLSILHNARVATAAIGESNEMGSTARSSSLAARLRRQQSPSADALEGTGTEPVLRKIAKKLPQPSKKCVCLRPREWSPGPKLMVAKAPVPDVRAVGRLTGQQTGGEQTRPKQKKTTSTNKGQRKEVDGRGRPTKRRQPLPGETEKQFLIRIARQAHRRIPDFSDDEKEDGDDGDDVEVEDEKDKNPRPKETPIYPPSFGPQDKKTAPLERQRRVSFAENVDGVATRPRNMKMKGFIVDVDDNNEDDNEHEENYNSGGQAGDDDEGTGAGHGRRKRTNTTATKGHPSDKTMARWPLRDWTDVLGAAALSGGFSPEVLARTAQRCADLFGQHVAMDTLAGVGAEQSPAAPLSVSRTVYTSRGTDFSTGPSAMSTATAEADTKALDELTLEVKRAHTRRQDRLAQRETLMKQMRERMQADVPTLAAGGADAEDQEDDEGSTEEDDDVEDIGSDHPKGTSAASQPRSISVVPLPVIPGAPTAPPKPKPGPQKKPTPNIWYCPRPNCPRALDGFTRRPNMVRHMKLMHNVVLGPDDKAAA